MDFSQNVTFFESVTPLGLVRISETRAIARKDLSLLTLLFTNEFINLNWNLNESGKENMHRSIWNENDQSSRQRVQKYLVKDCPHYIKNDL